MSKFTTLCLKNACARPYCVKNRLKRLIYFPVNSAFSPIFALSGHRSSIFQTELSKTSFFRQSVASVGTPGHVAERCLNHKIKGVEGIYDRYDYFEERKLAHKKVAKLVEPLANQINI